MATRRSGKYLSNDDRRRQRKRRKLIAIPVVIALVLVVAGVFYVRGNALRQAQKECETALETWFTAQDKASALLEIRPDSKTNFAAEQADIAQVIDYEASCEVMGNANHKVKQLRSITSDLHSRTSILDKATDSIANKLTDRIHSTLTSNAAKLKQLIANAQDLAKKTKASEVRDKTTLSDLQKAIKQGRRALKTAQAATEVKAQANALGKVKAAREVIAQCMDAVKSSHEDWKKNPTELTEQERERAQRQRPHRPEGAQELRPSREPTGNERRQPGRPGATPAPAPNRTDSPNRPAPQPKPNDPKPANPAPSVQPKPNKPAEGGTNPSAPANPEPKPAPTNAPAPANPGEGNQPDKPPAENKPAQPEKPAASNPAQPSAPTSSGGDS